MYIVIIITVILIVLYVLSFIHRRKISKKRHTTVMMENAVFLPQVIALANEGYNVIIPLKGYSMRPFLEDCRDKAMLVKITEPLKVGDVVLGEITPGRYALHRLIKVGKTHVQMLGDGNLTPDPVMPIENVRVIAKGFYRKGGARLERVDGRKFLLYSAVWMKLSIIQRKWLLRIWRRIPAWLRDYSFEGMANNEEIVKEIDVKKINSMKIKPGFQIHSVCGENIVMALGEENVDFSHIIALNESSLFIWNKMNEGVDNIDDLTKCITDEYDIDDATARKDVEALIQQLVKYGVVEE